MPKSYGWVGVVVVVVVLKILETLAQALAQAHSGYFWLSQALTL